MFHHVNRTAATKRLRSRTVLVAVAFVAVVTTVSCGQVQAPPELDAPAIPLRGVWSITTVSPGGSGETIEPAQSGLVIFTTNHYSAVHSDRADPRPLPKESFNPTTEEKVAQYDTIIVSAGTYDVNGSSIVFRPMVAKSAELVGGELTSDYQIAGELLTITIRAAVAVDGTSNLGAAGKTLTLRRLE